MADEVVPVKVAAEAAGYPVIGESVEGLKSYLIRKGKLENDEAFARVREDAVRIVRDCVRFDAPDATRTGICVGYVQSGKTLSMTVVSALARDNGCRIVIMLAGVTNILLRQSFGRFRDDLREAGNRPNSWKFFNSAEGFGAPQIRTLQQAILDWRDPIFKDDQQTLFYVVLKHHSHLDELTEMLKEADLKGVPALVIDDEADQAGLNTNPDEGPEDASTIYRCISRVRAALPHHTYLQYTATPQAPLLIALDDMLSPEFAELVRPGTTYTGGQTFFGTNAVKGLIKPIPQEDLFKPGAPPTDMPVSLVEALRVFFIGCAIASSRGRPKLRSMLVHPSQRNKDHERYLSWISEAQKRWILALRSPQPVDRDDALKEFKPAYDELAKTIIEHEGPEALPLFSELLGALLITLTRVQITEVNSQEGTEIDWENATDFILVGGEKLNRGYTVEGLTVTYMPREGGGWNADTIQQRARFFGYKAPFISLCRLYLNPEVIAAFRSYVRHEEDVRRQLEVHRGRPLREWRRAFFLDAKLRPTRQNVLRDPYTKIAQSKGWFAQRFPHEAALDANRKLLAPFEQLTFEKGVFTHHLSTEVPLSDIYEMLVSLDARRSDVPNLYAQLVMIDDILANNPTAKACLILMRADAKRDTRERTVGNGEIKLFQGEGSTKKTGGDDTLFDHELVTVQIHRINVKDGGPKDVRAVAVHIPDALRGDVGAQPQKA